MKVRVVQECRLCSTLLPTEKLTGGLCSGCLRLARLVMERRQERVCSKVGARKSDGVRSGRNGWTR